MNFFSQIALYFLALSTSLSWASRIVTENGNHIEIRWDGEEDFPVTFFRESPDETRQVAILRSAGTVFDLPLYNLEIKAGGFKPYDFDFLLRALRYDLDIQSEICLKISWIVDSKAPSHVQEKQFLQELLGLDSRATMARHPDIRHPGLSIVAGILGGIWVEGLPALYSLPAVSSWRASLAGIKRLKLLHLDLRSENPLSQLGMLLHHPDYHPELRAVMLGGLANLSAKSAEKVFSDIYGLVGSREAISLLLSAPDLSHLPLHITKYLIHSPIDRSRFGSSPYAEALPWKWWEFSHSPKIHSRRLAPVGMRRSDSSPDLLRSAEDRQESCPSAPPFYDYSKAKRMRAAADEGDLPPALEKGESNPNSPWVVPEKILPSKDEPSAPINPPCLDLGPSA